MKPILSQHLELIAQTRDEMLAFIDAMSPDDRKQVSDDYLALLRASAPVDPWIHGFVIKRHGKDAPIGSLKGEAGEEDNSQVAPMAATPDPVTKGSMGSTSKDVASSKEALHEGFAKAFSKNPAQGKSEGKHEKPAKASKASKASKMAHTKTPSRAASSSASSKSKKSGAPKTGSAFDPLNGSLP